MLRQFPARKIRIALLSIALTSALSTAVLAADAEDPFEPVRQRIARALVDSKTPSIAVAVARDGKIVWEQGFGWADRENRVPANEHTMYSLASISKPITATGLMVLSERGLVDLDKPANNYLGEAKLRARVGDAAEATVRRVANHTSGLPLHYQFFYADQPYTVPTREETIRRYGNLVTAPGEHYQYSNLGYGVLDYVIERAGGKKYAEFMRAEVFLPLGMTHTSIDIGPGLEPHQAIRYTFEGRRLPFYDFDHPGASAVFASAHDLVRFAMFHMKDHLADQRSILKDETIDQMQAATTQSRPGNGYGIGWASSQTLAGHRVIEHSGGMPGVSTICTLVPAEHVAVVVLTNTASPLTGMLRDMLLKIVLADKKPANDAAPKSPAERLPFAADGSPPGSELVGTWKGKLVTYRGERPLVVQVRAADDVHLKLGDQLETLLTNPRVRDGFFSGRFAGDIDHEDARGRPYQLQLELKVRGEVLNGPVTATTLTDWRGSSAVTHWVELERKSPAEPKPAAGG